MNHRTLFSFMLTVSLLTGAVPALADTQLDKLVFEVKLGGGGKPLVDNATQFKDPVVVPVPVPMEVHCSTGVDCSQIAANFAGQKVILTVAPDKSSASAQLETSSAGNNLILTFDKAQPPLVVKVTPATGGSGGSAGLSALNASDVAGMLQNPCTSLEPGSKIPDVGYSDNKADVLVAVNGRIIAAPSENIDEDDTVTIWLLADSRLKSILNVKRSSAIRTVGSFNIVGEGQKLTQGALQTHPCEYMPFTVKDFAPGKGEVEIDTIVGTATTKVASFEFVVDKLYRGMFSYAAISSDVVDRTFKLAPAAQGSGNVIVASENGNRQLRYAVLLTVFVWGQRDIEKPEPLLHHFNPCFGITTNNNTDNAIVGLSFDWNGFLIVGGIHYGHVTALAKGYQVGGAFSGADTAIPTTKQWKSGAFLGAAIDLRAAVSLLRTVVSAPASGGK